MNDLVKIESPDEILLSDVRRMIDNSRSATAEMIGETLNNAGLIGTDERNSLPKTDIFRHPQFLKLLGLKNPNAGLDFKTAILREIERFLLGSETHFTLVARQKRIVIDDEDYYLDLLFYHRKLRRLILIELKIGKLKAADTGQIELYLRWLDKYERQAGEETPIGLILCTEKGGQMIELLELEQRGIRVAEYLTELPPREMLERKLLDAVRLAKLEQENK